MSIICCNRFPHSIQSSLSKIFVFFKNTKFYVSKVVFQNVFLKCCISKCILYFKNTKIFVLFLLRKDWKFWSFRLHKTWICPCLLPLLFYWSPHLNLSFWKGRTSPSVVCTDPGLNKKRGSDLFRNKHMIQFGPIRIEARLFLFCWLHQVFSFGMWDLVPWPGIHSGPLHWEYGVLATGPQAKSFARSFYHGC